MERASCVCRPRKVASSTKIPVRVRAGPPIFSAMTNAPLRCRQLLSLWPLHCVCGSVRACAVCADRSWRPHPAAVPSRSLRPEPAAQLPAAELLPQLLAPASPARRASARPLITCSRACSSARPAPWALATAAPAAAPRCAPNHQACGPSSSTSRLQRISLSHSPSRRHRRRCAAACRRRSAAAPAAPRGPRRRRRPRPLERPSCTCVRSAGLRPDRRSARAGI